MQPGQLQITRSIERSRERGRNRKHQFWERNSLSIDLGTKEVQQGCALIRKTRNTLLQNFMKMGLKSLGF